MVQILKRGKTIEQKADIDSKVRVTVEEILSAIEKRGEAAVREFSKKFDQWEPPSLRLSDAEIAACIQSLPAQAIDDIRTTVDNSASSKRAPN